MFGDSRRQAAAVCCLVNTYRYEPKGNNAMKDLGDLGDRTDPVDPVDPPPPKDRRPVVWATIICIVCLALGALLGSYFHSWNAQPNSAAPPPAIHEETVPPAHPETAVPAPQATNTPAPVYCQSWVDLSSRVLTQNDIDSVKAAGCADTLYLYGATVTDDLMEQLATIPKVDRVELTRVKGLSSTGYAALAKIATLRYLNVQDTSFGDADLIPLSALSTLEELDVSHTRVTNAAAAPLGNLHSLTRLWLDDDDVGDDVLAYMHPTQLWQLQLDGTHVTDAGVARVAANIPDLKFLGISRTQVTNQGIATLSSMHALWGVELNGLSIDGTALATLAQAHADLTWLEISHTQIANADFAHLRAFDKLTRFRANGVDMQDGGLKNLVAPRLSEVELDDTRITDNGVAILFKNNPEVSFVSIRDNKGVTDAGVPSMIAAPALQWINVNGTAVSREREIGKLHIRKY